MLAKGRWDMFRLRRSAKWPLWCFQQRRSFAACRGVLTLRLEANGVLGAIPAGSRAAPAGATCPPDLDVKAPRQAARCGGGGAFHAAHLTE